MEVTRKIIEEIEVLRHQKQNLLALVRGGHAQPKGMTKNEAIKVLIADIAACDDAIVEARQRDAWIDIEVRSRFFL